MAINNVSDDYSRHVGQVCENHYARLRHYFLTQLGSAPEADHCVQETIYRFFIFAGDRRWEEVVEHVPGCVMRMAALLCSEKLAERKRLADARKDDDSESTLQRMTEEATRAIQERLRVKPRSPQRPE